MFVAGCACTGIIFATGSWVTRLVILAWWPMSDVAAFLAQRWFPGWKNLPVTKALVKPFDECYASPDIESYHALASSPLGSWESVLFSNIDSEFLHELDDQFDENSTTIAETLVRMRRNNQSTMPSTDPHGVRPFAYERVERVFSSACLGQAELLYAEERLARCLYLADDDVLKMKVLYCWVVIMYRLHANVDLITIIDRLDDMMGTAPRHYSMEESDLITHRTALRQEWISLMDYVRLVRSSCNYALDTTVEFHSTRERHVAD